MMIVEKQIKINILLSDLLSLKIFFTSFNSENSNGLDYAMGSHKLSLLDKTLIRFLNF